MSVFTIPVLLFTPIFRFPFFALLFRFSSLSLELLLCSILSPLSFLYPFCRASLSGGYAGHVCVGCGKLVVVGMGGEKKTVGGK